MHSDLAQLQDSCFNLKSRLLPVLSFTWPLVVYVVVLRVIQVLSTSQKHAGSCAKLPLGEKGCVLGVIKWVYLLFPARLWIHCNPEKENCLIIIWTKCSVQWLIKYDNIQWAVRWHSGLHCHFTNPRSQVKSLTQLIPCVKFISMAFCAHVDFLQVSVKLLVCMI